MWPPTGAFIFSCVGPSKPALKALVGGVFGHGFATGLCIVLHVLSFLLKVVIMIWLQMALRWTLPRFRYDQVMDLCWKMILPLSIVNVFVTAGLILFLERGA